MYCDLAFGVRMYRMPLISKNVAVVAGLVGAVVVAFYPIYFHPKLFPEEYSELYASCSEPQLP